jgi:hypothetical protein
MLREYYSIEDFSRAANGAKDRSRGGDSSWYGNESFEDALQGCINGDVELIAEADKLLEKIDGESLETTAHKWVPSPQGAFVCVPDYLNNSPFAMRNRKKLVSDLSPIKIYIATTCSAALDSQTMLRRGIAALALLRKLESLRPVQLFLTGELHGEHDGICLQVIRIESQPLNMSVTCYALSHVAFARKLSYSLARKTDGFNGNWPDMHRLENGRTTKRYNDYIRTQIGMEPQDIYIPSAHVYDLMLTDPVDWVNRTVAEACNIQD